MTAKIIVFGNTKGGVAKTTSAANVGALLGNVDATLLMDWDSQGQIALWYGLDPRSMVYERWVKGYPLVNTTILADPQSQLWLMLGDSKTNIVEGLDRTRTQEGINTMVGMVRALGEFFHFVVIDTASKGVLQEVAFMAADEIVVPFRTETPGVDGLFGVLGLLKKKRVTARVTALPVDMWRVNEHKRNLQVVIDKLGAENVADPIPHTIAVAEAVSEGKTMLTYHGDGIEKVRVAYAKLVNRLLAGWERQPSGEEEWIRDVGSMMSKELEGAHGESSG